MRMPGKINNINSKPIFNEMQKMSLEQKKTAIRFGLEYVERVKEKPEAQKIKFKPNLVQSSIDMSKTKKQALKLQ